MSLKVVVIDDHEVIRSTLIKELASVQGFNLVGEAGGVVAGLKLIKEQSPDLVLLDVEMGDGTGFDLLSILPTPRPAIIFVTSHDDYAIQAFKFSAIDYVLKPIDTDDLHQALDKAKANLNPSSLHIDTLLQNREQSHQHLVLADQKNTYLVDTDTIVRCEGQANYTSFYLADERTLVISKPLKYYADMLKNQGFFRSHQSHLINMAFFDRYDRTDGGMVHLRNKDIVPISTRRREELQKALLNFGQAKR